MVMGNKRREEINKIREEVIEMLSDLIMINDDRIVAYQQVIDNAHGIDADLKNLFKEIIIESANNKLLLLKKIKDLNTHAKKDSFVTGKIYRAWVDLKMSFFGIANKSFRFVCQYNENITKRVYLAALNSFVNLTPDVRQLLENQVENLNKRNLLALKQYEPHRYATTSLTYFN
jgi:uncharacterized protein (TIGR02284 family)